MAEMMEQEGFAAPPPIEGGGVDPALINEAEAMPPQEGGTQSIADDISVQANAEDYILPYESVLLVGLNQLNRYAKEAIKLAEENNVDLSASAINPEDDVPIRISNYEYVIPNGLVPFFAGGKNYLDKIRQEGMDFRKQQEEQNLPDAISQQEAEAPIQQDPMAGGFAGPPEGAMPPPEGAMPPPEAMMAGAPEGGMPPMMQKGGFVLSKDQDAAILEEDKPATAETKRTQTQQPAMVTPEGKRIKQGLSAPMGYKHGGEIHQGLGFVPKDITPANVSQMRQNAEDAANILKGYEKSFMGKQRTDERLA